jgi:hypothetical protein
LILRVSKWWVVFLELSDFNPARCPSFFAPHPCLIEPMVVVIDTPFPQAEPVEALLFVEEVLRRGRASTGSA